MFVRTVEKGNGRVSLRIVENIKVNGKVKQKTVCGLGTFHKDETKDIEAFKKIGDSIIPKIRQERASQKAIPGLENEVFAPKKRKRRKTAKDDIEKAGCFVEDLEEEKRIQTGTTNIFSNTYKQLDLSDSINTGHKQKEYNELLEKVVLERIHDPQSKMKTAKNLERKKGDSVDLNKVYRMMDRLKLHIPRVKDKILKNTRSLFQQKIDVVFFDVTTLYFESFTPDELRVSGYSKDNKVKETQVMLALMTTQEGLPLGYELFPGNTYEGNTLLKSINTLRESYDLSNTFVVADRGMFVSRNLAEMEKMGIHFIISAKLRKMNKSFREDILRESMSVKKSSSKYWIKEYEYDGRRLIVSYSEKRANKKSL